MFSIGDTSLNMGGDGSSVDSYLNIDITTSCNDFNVATAIQMMGQKITCTTTEGTKTVNGPVTTTKSSSVCACCVRHFIAAGLNRDSEAYKRFIELGRSRYPNGVHWHTEKIGNQSKIAYIGFNLYKTMPAGSSREQIKAWCAKNCMQGDIALMYNKGDESAAGHICMYYGNGIWVSDFRQENGPYVYFTDKEVVTSKEMYFYRYSGCKQVKVEKPKNITNINTRGKIIMRTLQKKFGFTDEQIIGIGSSLYYESAWDITAVGDHGAARGIAQWHPDRQLGIVNYINNKFNYHYSVGKSFSDMSLEHQIEGIIYELENTEKATKNALVNKPHMKAEEACDIWTKKYERPEKVTYKKHCSYIKLARNALYS
jgi:hypothetical protein